MKLTQVDFQDRRDRLAEAMGPNSIAIIETSQEAMRNRDADYKYRTDSSFFYLTGFAEPEAVAVIETNTVFEIQIMTSLKNKHGPEIMRFRHLCT